MRLEKTLTREESKAGDLIPAGIYTFEVVDASDEVSKSGNDMIKLILIIYMPDGRERTIFDYLLEKMPYKIAHFFECIGKWDKYASGAFSADDCYGASGQVKIYIQESKDPQYGDKSSVADYLLTEDQEASKMERKVAAAKQQPVAGEFVDSDLDTDLPF